MKSTSKHVLGFWHYGIILTYMSLLFSVWGACLSTARIPRPDLGVIALLIAGICDGFDGMVARTRKNRTLDDKLFGVQIDSLCDLVAFGVAPTMIGVGMGYRRWYYALIYSFFILCGLVRLAHYNVKEIGKVVGVEITANGEQAESTGPRFEGMPITTIAISLPIFYLVATMITPSVAPESVCNVLPPFLMMFCYFVSGVLFVCRFKMPKLRVKGLVVVIVILTVTIISLALIRYYVCAVPPINGKLQ